MADAPPPLNITYHDTAASVRASWSSLCLNGGYNLYVDASGNLHAHRLGVDAGAL
ncbi:hypothetical protein RWH43_10685 [Microbacterium sp. KSW2-21]|uniref:N-acetylmuramoyl-L-alanine amidase n=1 Tax=Microbacterium algihabitans TaxID=3075992 RepID=A0ABU3RWR9_9MICO|nr:hypothetical protein [Microbacterium sp. KSW2-21]MDU0327220.1 hypothetical protein [Microbacterium sp. KSW2-21]